MVLFGIFISVLIVFLILLTTGLYLGFAKLILFFKALIICTILVIVGYFLRKISPKFKKKATIIQFSKVKDTSTHLKPHDEHDDIYIKILIDNHHARLHKGSGGIALKLSSFINDLAKTHNIQQGKVFVYFNKNKNTQMTLSQRTQLKFFGQASKDESFKQKIKNMWGTF